MDAQFFIRAKKVNRAVEYTDSEAIIPAVKSEPEIRKPLPNRRMLTVEERREIIQRKHDEINALEEAIVTERKTLLQLSNIYKTTRSGAAEVVVQNQTIRDLMVKRAALTHPDKWIEDIPNLTFKDVFESKRDTRKLGREVLVYQIKRRVEPIDSLYVDLGAAADRATLDAEAVRAEAVRVPVAIAKPTLAKTLGAMVTPITDAATAAVTAATAAATAATAAATGAIIGQRRVIKLKKATAAPIT